MRRWLTVLLLVLLPLQFTWTAAAAYCQHEVASTARHVGHHEHEHQPTAQADKADKAKADTAKLTGDNDCGYCHLSAAKPMRMQALAAPDLSGRPVEDVSAPPVPTRDPDHPDRPNWSLA